MAELKQTKPKEPTTPAQQELTLIDAAALVGKDVADCLAFKDYGDRVVVVTVDGQKLVVTKHDQD